MQLDQRCDIGARRADLHAGAGGRIQRPGRQHDDHGGSCLDVDHLAASALLTVLPSNAAPTEWMPRIMDIDFLPDMGRMNGKWPSGGATRYSPDYRPEDNALPRSIQS